MRCTFDSDLHLHSHISTCSSDPLQTPRRMLDYAKEYGLNTICITDHFWDETVPGASKWYEKQNYPWICQSKPLPQEDGIRFLFGCETDMDLNMTLGVAKENLQNFDFIIVSTTHLHMKGFAISEEDCTTSEGRAKVWAERLDTLLSTDLPFHKIGIAHLACPLIDNRGRKQYLATMNAIPNTEMVRLFTKAAQLGVGIEINRADMIFTDEEAETVLRPFRIAKKCGCKFYFGSDAHHPADLDASKEIFENAIDLLGLGESDKFII